MAPTRVSKTSRIVALAIAAKGEIELAYNAIDEIRASLTQWADALTIDADNLKQTAVGTQADAMRLAMVALSVRAASERAAIAAQLAADAEGCGK